MSSVSSYFHTETVQNLQNELSCQKHVILFLSTVNHAFLNIMTTFGWDCPKRPINCGLKMSVATEVGLNVPLKVTGTWTLWIRRQCSRNKLHGRGRPLPPLPLRPLPPPPTRPTRPGDELFTRLKGTGVRSPPLNKIWCLISGPTPF